MITRIIDLFNGAELFSGQLNNQQNEGDILELERDYVIIQIQKGAYEKCIFVERC